jgi:hypothetical protein
MDFGHSRWCAYFNFATLYQKTATSRPTRRFREGERGIVERKKGESALSSFREPVV